jgi:hypothetical protein
MLLFSKKKHKVLMKNFMNILTMTTFKGALFLKLVQKQISTQINPQV